MDQHHQQQLYRQHQQLSSTASIATEPASQSTTTTTTTLPSHREPKFHLIRSATLNPLQGINTPALRPEDLRVKPWYENASSLASRDSPPPTVPPCPVNNQSCDLDIGSVRGTEAASTRTSSMESEAPRDGAPVVPRKACMDLNDAIALLDETCPNPNVSPQLTPRTPLTPHPRNKRARSKSSDNSSNYSTERLNERPPQADKERKRPFLKKIGISMTLDKFVFDSSPRQRKGAAMIPEEPPAGLDNKTAQEQRRAEIRSFSTGERRRSGRNFLLKMYSFETEDLEDGPPSKGRRDPLRGASLDDVLESGTMAESGDTTTSSAAELVRCRVTTSEEIIAYSASDSSPHLDWGNGCPTTKGKEPPSVPNSPTKRTHSVTPEKVTAVYKELEVGRRGTGGRQSSDEILDKRKSRFERFETHSTDSLASGRVATPVFAEIGGKVNGKLGSSSSVVSSVASSTRHLQQGRDKFDGSQEVFKESYAEFKLRTRGCSSNALKRLVGGRERNGSPSFDLGLSCKEARVEGSPKARSKSAETKPAGATLDSEDSGGGGGGRRLRNRSVLRKQQGIEHSNYQPDEPVARRLPHEPSQETLDLLTELQRVKSQLRTPSETYSEVDATAGSNFPRRVLLTDREFCLSVERENSLRQSSRGKSLDDGDEDGSTAGPRHVASLGRGPRSEEVTELVTSDSRSYSSDVFNSPEESEAKPEAQSKKAGGRRGELKPGGKGPRERSKSPRSAEEEVGPRRRTEASEAPKVATPFRMKKRLGRISVEETVKQESFAAGKVECKELAVQKKAKCLPL
ncbi:uncharacterized protein LOC106647547 [Copidosoma floridanum]|uniref:uncharacterized protein LOC106647547 n=1 Tax=Copidosoma floridanum TaxID=29053 RepID=UPI0006C9B608|nr:uncharacterized protein LOC106647547 [Copidosoma floridanum]